MNNDSGEATWSACGAVVHALERGMKQMLVRDAGEFGLIDLLESTLPPAARVGGGLDVTIGDDAAVWYPPAGEAVVVTTDSLVEGIHFRLDWTDWERLGHKALAVNLSDLAAMGARPGIAVVSLGLRGSERIADLEALYRGMGDLALQTGIRIAGGDVVASPSAITITVTALGSTRGGRVLRRTGAQPGDLIGVTGTLGAAAAGLRLLQAGGMNARRRAATADQLIDAHLRPQPRLEFGRLLLEKGATAAMDLSDGLLGDLPKILVGSHLRARIREQAIPVAAAVRALFPEERLQLALRGGEDYELLFTAPLEYFSELRRAAADTGCTITEIGVLLPADDDQPILTLETPTGERPLRLGAFDHFAP